MWGVVSKIKFQFPTYRPAEKAKIFIEGMKTLTKETISIIGAMPEEKF